MLFGPARALKTHFPSTHSKNLLSKQAEQKFQPMQTPYIYRTLQGSQKLSTSPLKGIYSIRKIRYASLHRIGEAASLLHSGF